MVWHNLIVQDLAGEIEFMQLFHALFKLHVLFTCCPVQSSYATFLQFLA